MRPVFPVSRLGMSVICKMWKRTAAQRLFFFLAFPRLNWCRGMSVTCSTFYPVDGRTTALYCILENHQGKHGERQSKIVERQHADQITGIISRSVRGGQHWSSHPPTDQPTRTVSPWLGGASAIWCWPGHGSRAPSHKKKKEKMNEDAGNGRGTSMSLQTRRG
jgi:hypothetical protein